MGIWTYILLLGGIGAMVLWVRRLQRRVWLLECCVARYERRAACGGEMEIAGEQVLVQPVLTDGGGKFVRLYLISAGRRELLAELPTNCDDEALVAAVATHRAGGLTATESIRAN